MRHDGAGKWLAVPLALVVLALLIVPLARLALESLHASGGLLDAAGSAGTSAANYLRILRERDFRLALLHSVGLSAAVALVSTFVCLAPAWVLARGSGPGARALRTALALPMAFSGIIVGFLTVIMLGRVGFVPQLSELLVGRPVGAGVAYTFGGLVLAYLYFEIPRAALTLEAALRVLDPRIDAAARSLGAGWWRRTMLVTLPLLAPAITSTLAVTFSASLGSFGVALIVAKRFSVLPLEIFQQYIGLLDTGLAAAMTVTLAVIALLVNGGVGLLTRRWAEWGRGVG